MTSTDVGFTYDHDNHVCPALQISIPAREQPGVAGPGAAPNQIRMGEHFADPFPVSGKKIRVAFDDVSLPFVGQFYLAIEVWTRKPWHAGFPTEVLWGIIGAKGSDFRGVAFRV